MAKRHNFNMKNNAVYIRQTPQTNLKKFDIKYQHFEMKSQNVS